LTRQQRGEETDTYRVGDTLWLMLVWHLVIMLMSIMLKINRDVGVAVRQVEVEGCYGVQVGVDRGNKLSLMTLQMSLHCTISLRSLELLHCTPPSFNTLSLFHYQKKKSHKLRQPSNFIHSMMHIFNPKQRSALALTKCRYFISLASDSTRFGALDSATQMTTSLKLKFTPNVFVYRFGHFVIKFESCNDVTQLSALFFTVRRNLFQVKKKQ